MTTIDLKRVAELYAEVAKINALFITEVTILNDGQPTHFKPELLVEMRDSGLPVLSQLNLLAKDPSMLPTPAGEPKIGCDFG